MLRWVPLLIVVGAAVFSFFDVLATEKHRFVRARKGTWLVVSLLPVLGALLWFAVGRPQRRSSPGRVVHLRPSRHETAPDDDPAFLKKLDEQAWRARRAAERAAAERAAAERAATERAASDAAKPPGRREAPSSAGGDVADGDAPDAKPEPEPPGPQAPGPPPEQPPAA